MSEVEKKCQLREFCRLTLESMQSFYENPDNVRNFEKWKAEREKKLLNA